MASIFRPSRIIAVAMIVGAALWIASGSLGDGESASDVSTAALAPGLSDPTSLGEDEDGESSAAVRIPVQKVSVATVESERHDRTILLSCVTRAENRAVAVARGAGVLLNLTVQRGDMVEAGQIIARISDEGRQASVKQAEALLAQRLAEYDANKALIDRGNAPRNSLPALEAGVAAARAAVAAAQAEADRSLVKAPIAGVVDTVPAEVGQAVQVGMSVAEIVDPDPMLAVASVSEARRTSVRSGQSATIRFIDNSTVDGQVKFVGLSADTATRTYPVEATVANADMAIADGVTCEMAVELGPVEASSVPRSALVFSDEGVLGVRVSDADSMVHFLPVGIVDDGSDHLWVSGLEGSHDVIIVGQDFVEDGDLVEAVREGDGDTAEAVATAESPA